ncbi:hypothetical protein HID58_036998, partial [Brassica napus]
FIYPKDPDPNIAKSVVLETDHPSSPVNVAPKKPGPVLMTSFAYSIRFGCDGGETESSGSGIQRIERVVVLDPRCIISHYLGGLSSPTYDLMSMPHSLPTMLRMTSLKPWTARGASGDPGTSGLCDSSKDLFIIGASNRPDLT